jgi:hypothetical protein
MSNELNWSTQSRTEIQRAKKALHDVKEAQGAQRMVKVDNYHICVPASLTRAEIELRVENHKKRRAQ